jgi:hypothetical protein
MLSTSIPTKFPIPFASSAAPGFTRPIPQTSTDPTVASLALGFPPATATPVAAGGTPPNVADFNGLLEQITAWAQWQAAVGPIGYDAAFSSEIGGYPAGTILAQAGNLGHYWISTVENNVTDPDTGGAGWTGFTYIGLAPINSPTFTGVPAAPTPTAGDNTTKLATTAFVTTACNAILSTANTYAAAQAAAALAAAEAAACLRANNLGDVASASAARGNLGLGSAALKTASDAGEGNLASVSGATTVNNIATFDDTNGSLKDSGVPISAVGVPSGAVFWFAASAPPSGYFEANGAAVSRTSYAALFAVCGTTFGAGDGSTTFNLPDLRGEFVRGWDDGRGVDSGRTFGSAQTDAFASHTHEEQIGSDNSGLQGTGHGGGPWFFGTQHIQTGAAGGTETRPKNVALLPCIKQ